MGVPSYFQLNKQACSPICVISNFFTFFLLCTHMDTQEHGGLASLHAHHDGVLGSDSLDIRYIIQWVNLDRMPHQYTSLVSAITERKKSRTNTYLPRDFPRIVTPLHWCTAINRSEHLSELHFQLQSDSNDLEPLTHGHNSDRQKEYCDLHNWLFCFSTPLMSPVCHVRQVIATM